MSALFLHLILVLYLMVSPSLAQPRNYARPGETARGEVVREGSDQLQLNITPCTGNRTVIIFRKPYTRESASTINCKGEKRNLVQAIQK
jgi:hypothetical protein